MFGVFVESPYRWIEHAAWVVFEDLFLARSCIRGFRETRELCDRQAVLEATNENIEVEVSRRTDQLRTTNSQLEAEVVNRKQIAQQLGEREATLHSIFTSMIDVMVVIDARGNILQVSDSVESVFGWKAAELVGHNINIFMPEPHHPNHGRYMRTFLDTGETSMLGQLRRLEAVRKDGSKFPCEVLAWQAPVAVQSRPIMAGIIRDITDRERAEAEGKQLQQEMVSMSRQAGMAEIASGVLHNVGNVLNSVNVSTNLIVNAIRSSHVVGLTRVVELLEQQNGNLPEFFAAGGRGVHVPKFLRQLSSQLVAEHEQVLAEAGGLAKNVEHIKEIVAMQQSYASVSGTREKLQLADVVNEAIRLNDARLKRHDVELVRQYEDSPEVVADKHRIIQILVNLISNATHAAGATERSDKRITMGVRTCGDQALIQVEDNGVGIAPEHLAKIFQHGFTTKPRGHGFGLHSSALVAKELGGSLNVQSEGTGRGATFTLSLPLSSRGAVASEERATGITPAQPVVECQLGGPAALDGIPTGAGP